MTLLWAAKALDDPLRQVFIDLAMTGHRLRLAGLWVSIPIVISAMANKHTPSSLQLLDQIATLHET